MSNINSFLFKCPYCDTGLKLERNIEEDIEFIAGNPTVTCPECKGKIILPNEINLVLLNKESTYVEITNPNYFGGGQ